MAKSPLAPPVPPLARLIAAFGVVSEFVTRKKEVAEAVVLVLGYEQNKIHMAPALGMPLDQAGAFSHRSAGKGEGLDVAALALLDPGYIEEQRDLLQAEIDAAKTAEHIEEE